MAKKRRHRTWWFPVFTSEIAEIRKKGSIGSIEESDFPVLFSEEMFAYGYKASKRLEVDRDSEGNVVTNDNDYAQLRKVGKISLIGIKGKDIDWKNTFTQPAEEGPKGEMIVCGYNIPLNKQTLDKVFEESDEMYNKFALSPLAQAGGIEAIDTNSDAAENLQPTTES